MKAPADRDVGFGHDSAATWLIRGLVAGILVIGSANAISFFVRSQGWGGLLGHRDFSDEAIGFPLLIWQESGSYGNHPLRWSPFLINAATAILLGLAIGCGAIWKRPVLNQIMQRFQGDPNKPQVKLQFSLRGLLITTVLAALASALARSFTPIPEVLGAIYVLGPLALVVLAYLPRQLSWQQRVAVITPATLMLIAVSITLGITLGIEFDKVLMGIFICWTPQAALGAIGLSSWLLWREWQTIRRLQESQSES